MKEKVLEYIIKFEIEGRKSKSPTRMVQPIVLFVMEEFSSTRTETLKILLELHQERKIVFFKGNETIETTKRFIKRLGKRYYNKYILNERQKIKKVIK